MEWWSKPFIKLSQMLYVHLALQTQPLLHIAVVSSIHLRERVTSREGYHRHHRPSLDLHPWHMRGCHVGSFMSRWTLGLRTRIQEDATKVIPSWEHAFYQWYTELVFQEVCIASSLLLWCHKSKQVLYGMWDQENSLCIASSEGTWKSLIMIVKQLSKSQHRPRELAEFSTRREQSH